MLKIEYEERECRVYDTSEHLWKKNNFSNSNFFFSLIYIKCRILLSIDILLLFFLLLLVNSGATINTLRMHSHPNIFLYFGMRHGGTTWLWKPNVMLPQGMHLQHGFQLL